MQTNINLTKQLDKQTKANKTQYRSNSKKGLLYKILILILIRYKVEIMTVCCSIVKYVEGVDAVVCGDAAVISRDKLLNESHSQLMAYPVPELSTISADQLSKKQPLTYLDSHGKWKQWPQ